MDTEGARALAARIAAGPPDEDGNPKTQTPRVPEAAQKSAVEIVYLKPEQAAGREVRIYVRGRDGTLERQP
jgi:hypothetical protein